MKRAVTKIGQSLRWHLGLPVAATELETGTDESVAGFYNKRITECTFLDDMEHYEYPRARWVLEQVNGGKLLEIGCGNGGMTRLLAPKVDHLTAFDVSAPSLKQVEDLGFTNVVTAQGLIEKFEPDRKFDWIVMSEVLEHLRKPLDGIRRCVSWLDFCGSLIITTPNGHWESDEHLHEFSMKSFTELLVQTNAESFQVSYLRDRDNRRRWLVGVVNQFDTSPTKDEFHSRAAIVRERKKT